MKHSVKKALITGITGQDGAYLTKLLLEKGYIVFGTTRNIKNVNLDNLKKLKVENKIRIIETDLLCFSTLLETLQEIKPNLVFHFACQSSVSLSFQFPYESIISGSTTTLNILECIKKLGIGIKFFLPVSSECFGNLNKNNPANEMTQHNPISPYAVSKSSSYWIAKTYRDSFNLFISIGFMSNHESPLRGNYYVIPKLLKQLKILKNTNKKEPIKFGDLSVIRDWGWAPLYVDAIYKIITNEKPDDFVIATGKSYKLEDVVKKAFKLFGLDSSNGYVQTPKEIRSNEIKGSYMDPTKAKKILNWSHNLEIDGILNKLINDELF